jgi:hypothetical protein
MIRITTPSPFLADEFRRRDPDSFEIIEWLWLEVGDRAFSIRPELFRDLDWLELRLWGALARLFAHEFLAEIRETIH